MLHCRPQLQSKMDNRKWRLHVQRGAMSDLIDIPNKENECACQFEHGSCYQTVSEVLSDRCRQPRRYVHGKLQDRTSAFLINTGATESFVFTLLFDEISQRLKPKLTTPNRTFRQVDGSKLRISGRAKMNISIDGCKLMGAN